MTAFDRKEKLCRWARERIEAHLDNELSPEDAGKLENHLKTCTPCAAEWSLARQVQQSLRSLPEMPCPERVLSTVASRISSEEAPDRKSLGQRLTGLRWRTLRPAAFAAAMSLVIAASVFIAHKQRSRVASYAPGETRLEVNEEALALAEAEIKWTFAYIGEIGRRTGFTLRDRAIYSNVVVPVQHAVEAAFDGKMSKQPQQSGQNQGGAQ